MQFRSRVYSLAALLTLSLLSIGLFPSAARADDTPAIGGTGTPDYRTYGTWHSGAIGGGGFLQYLVFAPSDRNRCYMTTDVGGLYRSDDGGLHWHMLAGYFPADAGSYSARGLVVDPARADHVIAAMGAGESAVNGIYVSDDGGKSWRRTLKVRFDGNGDYRMDGPILIASPADPNTLYCAAIESGVYRSLDMGQSWEHIGPSQPVQPTGLLIDATNPTHIWLTNASYKFPTSPSRRGIYYTADDGAHWDYICSWLPEKIIQDPADPHVLIGLTERDQIKRSTDGGRTWQPMSKGLPPFVKEQSWSRPGSVDAIAAVGKDLVIGDQSAAFYRLDRSTDTWQKIPQEGVDEQNWWGRKGPGRGQHMGNAMSHMGVDPHDPNHWWFTDWYAVYQTYDAGRHWKLTLDGIEMLCFHCVRQDPALPNTVHTGTADLGYFRSDNGGSSYYWITNGINNNIKDIRLCPSAPDRMYAIGPSGGDWYSNQVFMSHDHGRSWERSSMKGLPDMSSSRCNTIAVAPNAPDDVFLAVSDEVKNGGGGGGVYESTDGGHTWKWKGDGLPTGRTYFHKDIWVSGPELDVSADGSMVATSNDHRLVYRWDTQQSKWVPAHSGVADAHPNTLIADPSTPGRFYLAANEAGLLRSDDGGDTWHVVSHRSISCVTIDVTRPQRLAAITPDNVLFSDDGGQTWTAIGATLPYRAARNVAGFAGDRLVVGTSGTGAFWTDLAEAVKAGQKLSDPGATPATSMAHPADGPMLSATGDPLPVPVRPDDPDLLYSGRFDRTRPDGYRCDWSASAVTLRFAGTDLNTTLSSDNNQTRWQVTVDGQPAGVLALDNQPRTFRVASHLPAGAHTVTLMQRTEPLFGMTTLHGFALGGTGAKLLPMQRPDFQLEVVGDSISCGYGIEAAGASDHFSARTEDAVRTYGAIAAANLHAGYTCIAWSGRLLWPSNTMPSIYDRTIATEPQPAWSFPPPQPNAIVINLGTNDIWSFHGKDPDEQQWTAAYEQFISHLREHAPNAMIYCAVGPMVTDASSPSKHALTHLRQYLHEIVDHCHAAGDARVRFLEFATQDASDGVGSDWHPSVKTHEKMAATLLGAMRSDFPALADAAGSTPVSNPMP